MPVNPEATLCPLCHQPNACAMAAAGAAQHCWCMDAPISRAALARVPHAQRGLACICPRCAQATIIDGKDDTTRQDTPCPLTTSK
ncbi:cysteine-rich CWC family protein [Comamonas faecalis]|uniref:cysteine-rich CWC family protein n=1 Tax=Comamonas faecalis TaxID=1387849 RepID=UPI000C9F2140